MCGLEYTLLDVIRSFLAKDRFLEATQKKYKICIQKKEQNDQLGMDVKHRLPLATGILGAGSMRRERGLATHLRLRSVWLCARVAFSTQGGA